MSVVSVGPYCTSDGDVHNSIGISGNRQNTKTEKKEFTYNALVPNLLYSIFRYKFSLIMPPKKALVWMSRIPVTCYLNLTTLSSTHSC